MDYLTDRKRVRGLGASHTGTEHHWSMTVTSVALLILVPLFLCAIAPRLGQDHATVTAYLARPFPAIVIGLTLIVGAVHFKNGVRVAIEDYVHGLTREVLIVAMALASYAVAATGLFAIARIAL